MSFLREAKRQLRAAVLPCIFLGVAAYFVWNAVQGDRGTLMAVQRRDVLAVKQTELTQVDADRALWERRVGALRGARIERDMLDERARAMLNLASPDEIIVQYDPKDRLF